MIEETSDMARLTDDVGFLLTRASGLVVRATNAALADDGLRVRQYSVLMLVCDSSEALSQRDLAAELGLDPSQVVVLVDELVAAGLVERRPSPTDRRAKLVAATPGGRRLRRRAVDRARDGVRHQLRALSDSEQDTLRALLARIVDDGRAADTAAS
jgi:DNA-binding MarR family transcriptional regulator